MHDGQDDVIRFNDEVHDAHLKKWSAATRSLKSGRPRLATYSKRQSGEMGGHVLAVHPMMAPASEIFLNAQVPGFLPSVDRLTMELRLSVD